MKKGLDIEEEDEKKMLDKLKAKYKPLTKLMTEVLNDMEYTIKAQAMKGYVMISHIVSENNMEINLKHSIMNTLKKKVVADKSNQMVKDMIWLLFDIFQHTSGFNFDEKMHHTVDLMDEYAIQQQKKFDGTKLRTMTREGLDIENDDEKKKPDELKERFELTTKLWLLFDISLLTSGFDLD
eukprot:13343895-Heterocapsa_arctica.AAC.1